MTGRTARSADADLRVIVGDTGWNMEMHQIRYFLALSKELNFTRAARRCGISQPSLTNAISALERQLGGALFRRRPRVALTALGRAVQPYLSQIARNVDEARAAAQALADAPPASPTALIALQDPGSPRC
jgi:DNA-binding transcriptional LysR family regulator